MTHKPAEVILRRDKATAKSPWTWAVYKLVEYGECFTENDAKKHCEAVKSQVEQGLA